MAYYEQETKRLRAKVEAVEEISTERLQKVMKLSNDLDYANTLARVYKFEGSALVNLEAENKALNSMLSEAHATDVAQKVQINRQNAKIERLEKALANLPDVELDARNVKSVLKESRTE